MPLPIGKNRLLQASDQRRVVKWFACSVGRWRNPHSLAEWRNALLARRSNRHLDLRQRLGYARRCNGMILPWDEKDPQIWLTLLRLAAVFRLPLIEFSVDELQPGRAS